MTPKLMLGAQEIKKQLLPFPSAFLGCGMSKSMKMVSWPFLYWVFHSAVFSHRRASPSNKKDEGGRDSLLHVTAV